MKITTTEQKNSKSEYHSAREAGISINAKTLVERKKLRQATEAFTEEML